ncbi:MAG: AAA family ATPase, partial [Blautia sp.]|nr:AAA family ATPase [Blautia sp.]
MKILSRIRLINWHRFENDTLDLKEKAILIAGENGSGKSTILDAIQFVLTCTKANFNKAASQDGTKRNLNTYIRNKDGKEGTPFGRTGPLSAHICLEFVEESGKHSAFLLGAVMDTDSEEKEATAAWYCMENQALEDGLFFVGDQVKSISAFRSTNNLKNFCTTASEARSVMLRRMGGLEKSFFALLPKALAFSLIKDIKSFVYSYVLDKKDLSIDALRENVHAYQDLERTLAEVKKKVYALEGVLEVHEKILSLDRTDKIQEYCIARAGRDITAEKIRTLRAALSRTEAALAALTEKREALEREQREKEELIRALTIELDNDEDYRALRTMEDQKDRHLEKLSGLNKTVKSLLRDISESVRSIENLQKDFSENLLSRYLLELGQIQEASSVLEATHLVNQVLAWKKEKQGVLYQEKGTLQAELIKRQEEKGKLEEKIRRLEGKKLTYEDAVLRLKDAIQTQFNRMKSEARVEILCELLEVTDVSWQNAIEGYLNKQRFYLVMPPALYSVALAVYERLRKENKVYGVGLINTEKLETYDEIPEGSLAAYVKTGNLYARRYINLILGRVHCCEQVDDLKNYPISITK